MDILDLVTRSGCEAMIESVEPDGAWCPMAHANGFDDSFQDAVPLRRIREVLSVPQPGFGWIGLGAFTGEEFAVCAFHGPSEPALAAFDYSDGSMLWTSPLEDLPPMGQWRQVSGVLMAKLRTSGARIERRIFAANPVEFVAYDECGERVWKQSVREILPQARNGIGTPRSFSIAADQSLVLATGGGWILKIHPGDGTLLDAYRMRTKIAVNGRLHRGVFYTRLSSVTHDNTLYLVVYFRADADDPLPDDLAPVFVVRIDLSRADRRGAGAQIVPLQDPRSPFETPPDRFEMTRCGTQRFAGSPVGMIGKNGHPVLIGATSTVIDGQIFARIVAVEDQGGVLSGRWHCTLDSTPGETVVAAPALYADAGIYVVATPSGIHLFYDAGELVGAVRPAGHVLSPDLLTPDIRSHAASVEVTSPVSVAFDKTLRELVAYVSVNVRRWAGGPPHGFLTAFAIPLEPGRAVRPLWTEALARTMSGEPAPGSGAYGQIALFESAAPAGVATGVILNTFANGTVMLR